MAKFFNARLRGRKALIGNREAEFDDEGVAEMDEEQSSIVESMRGFRRVEVDPPVDDTIDAESDIVSDVVKSTSGETVSEVVESIPEGTVSEVVEETATEDRRISPDEVGLDALEVNKTEASADTVPAGEGQGATQDDSKQSSISRTPISDGKQQKSKRGGRRGKKTNA